MTRGTTRVARWCSLLLATSVLAACGGDDGGVGGQGVTPPPPDSNGLRLQPIVATLNAPVFVTAPSGDFTRLFVVERGGRIRIQRIDPISGSPTNTPLSTFLDISALVSTQGERGLLGMAFDPDYATNRRFYVFYTDNDPNDEGDIIIARYLRSQASADQADASADALLKTIEHTAHTNHNGGMLAFGPDRCLYAGVGDGGDSGDPPNNAQNRSTLLGKILRLDPDTGNSCTQNVANPFASGGGAPEVWSIGLRNPWRFSFDRQNGALYIGDVGQDRREEVDAILGPNAGRGLNFGWRLMEGFLCFNPASGCSNGSLTLPVLDYTHDNGECSITGGYVYRGQRNSSVTGVTGAYFYGDFCTGFVRSFHLANGQPVQQVSWPLLSSGGQITSFGEDARGELYLTTFGGGLFRIIPN